MEYRLNNEKIQDQDIGVLSPESFPERGTVDSKNQTIPGKLGSLIILGSMEMTESCIFKLGVSSRIRTKYSETN